QCAKSIALAVADGKGKGENRGVCGRMAGDDGRATWRLCHHEAVARRTKAEAEHEVVLHQLFGCPTPQKPVATAARAGVCLVVGGFLRSEQTRGCAPRSKVRVICCRLNQPSNHGVII